MLCSAELTFGADFLEVLAEIFEVGVGKMFDLNHFITRVFERMDDFVELEVDGTGVAILGVLN